MIIHTNIHDNTQTYMIIHITMQDDTHQLRGHGLETNTRKSREKRKTKTRCTIHLVYGYVLSKPCSEALIMQK